MKQCRQCRREFPDQMVFCPFDGEVLRAEDAYSLIGRTVAGTYRIDAKIGEGGMGVVYRAFHTRMQKDVALKVLHASLVSDTTAVARFKREAQAAARIKHPNAVTVLDFGVDDDTVMYIVMELFEGDSLREILEREKRLPVSEAIEIVRQACTALDAAHHSGVIHRDIKPDNILVSGRANGKPLVKLLDFGIAKLKDAATTTGALTRQGVIIGSPHYLSPEQCQSAELDARSDVYSLGIVTYEMLTGAVPFTADSPIAVALKHTNELPESMRVVRDEVPDTIDQVVLRSLSKDPTNRQQTAMDLADELVEAERLARESAPRPAPSAGNRERRAERPPTGSTPKSGSPKTVRPDPPPLPPSPESSTVYRASVLTSFEADNESKHRRVWYVTAAGGGIVVLLVLVWVLLG